MCLGTFLSSLPGELLPTVQYPVPMGPPGDTVLPVLPDRSSHASLWVSTCLDLAVSQSLITWAERIVALLFPPVNCSLPYFPSFYCSEQHLEQSGCSLCLFTDFISFREKLFSADSSPEYGGEEGDLDSDKKRCVHQTSAQVNSWDAVTGNRSQGSLFGLLSLAFL